MKKLIASLCAAAAFAAVADTVTSDTVFGVLKVESTAAETVICAPWVAAGSTSEESPTPVKVKDLVKTSNLTVEDQLLQYVASSGTYNGWQLNSSKTWVGTAVVTKKGTATVADDATIDRGDALIIIRPTNHTDAIYLYGQYLNKTVTPTIKAGAWNLIAPANTSGTALDLNSGVTWNGVADGDYIFVQSAAGYRVRLVHKTAGWVLPYTTDTGSSKVQPGQGFWYVSTGSTAPTMKIN